MPRSQRNDNFIDKSFTVMADIILKIMPANKKAKEAFVYYRDGMSAQADGEYKEALDNYYQDLELEEDAFDRSYILYNIGLIHTSNGEHEKALSYYEQALESNPNMPQALNNTAVILLLFFIRIFLFLMVRNNYREKSLYTYTFMRIVYHASFHYRQIIFPI